APVVSDASGFFSRKTSNEGEPHRKPGGSGEEILGCESEELTPVGHGGLARIRLPGSGRRKTHGGIESKIRGHRSRQLTGIEKWKEALQPKQSVYEESSGK